MVYSQKQRLFLVVYEFGGAANDVVLYWENIDFHSNTKGSNIKGIPCFFAFLKNKLTCIICLLLNNLNA